MTKYYIDRKTKFKKDIKKLQKRGKNLSKIENVIKTLSKGENLDKKYHIHKLSGDWEHYWECHIESDWLLIWRYEEDAIILARTGTHSDLFR